MWMFRKKDLPAKADPSAAERLHGVPPRRVMRLPAEAFFSGTLDATACQETDLVLDGQLNGAIKMARSAGIQVAAQACLSGDVQGGWMQVSAGAPHLTEPSGSPTLAPSVTSTTHLSAAEVKTLSVGQLRQQAAVVVPFGATAVGSLELHGPQWIAIEGAFSGRIQAVGTGSLVFIAGTACLSGVEICADHIIIDGQFQGQLTASESLLLSSTCSVDGHIDYAGELLIQAGAEVLAGIHAHEPASAEQRQPAEGLPIPASVPTLWPVAA